MVFGRVESDTRVVETVWLLVVNVQFQEMKLLTVSSEFKKNRGAKSLLLLDFLLGFLSPLPFFIFPNPRGSMFSQEVPYRMNTDMRPESNVIGHNHRKFDIDSFLRCVFQCLVHSVFLESIMMFFIWSKDSLYPTSRWRGLRVRLKTD